MHLHVNAFHELSRYRNSGGVLIWVLILCGIYICAWGYARYVKTRSIATESVLRPIDEAESGFMSFVSYSIDIRNDSVDIQRILPIAGVNENAWEDRQSYRVDPLIGRNQYVSIIRCRCCPGLLRIIIGSIWQFGWERRSHLSFDRMTPNFDVCYASWSISHILDCRLNPNEGNSFSIAKIRRAFDGDYKPSSFDSSAGTNLNHQSEKQGDGENGNNESGKCIHVIHPLWRITGALIGLILAYIFGWFGVNYLLGGGWRGGLLFGLCLIAEASSFVGLFVFASGSLCLVCTQRDCEEKQGKDSFHSLNNVTQKLLTTPYYCNTLIRIGRSNMANVLSIDKQVQIISALAEGSGIRQIERMTGVHRDTIMRLGIRVGKGCASLMDARMRDLACEHLQFDELWGFIGKKQKHVTADDDPTCGDVWTFCAIDSDTKLVPSFKVGKRDMATANALVGDVASRLKNRVQISTDGLPGYVEAVEKAFGANVDYAQIIKVFDDSSMDAEVVGMTKKTFTGRPDMSLVTTSHVERLNGTTRLHMRRLTRLTYAFSKKRENFEAAVALHFAYYNFVKRHITLRATPAMAAGIEQDFWTVSDLVEAVA